MQVTYSGPLARGVVVLPDRGVPFVAGEPFEVTDEEAAHLADHPEWTTSKAKPAAKKKSDGPSK